MALFKEDWGVAGDIVILGLLASVSAGGWYLFFGGKDFVEDKFGGSQPTQVAPPAQTSTPPGSSSNSTSSDNSGTTSQATQSAPVASAPVSPKVNGLDSLTRNTDVKVGGSNSFIAEIFALEALGVWEQVPGINGSEQVGDALIKRKINVGVLSSVSYKQSLEQRGFVTREFGGEGVAFAVNANSPVKDFTEEQVLGIFNGSITEINGVKVNPVRSTEGGTFLTMKAAVGDTFGANVKAVGTDNPTLMFREVIQNTPAGEIGITYGAPDLIAQQSNLEIATVDGSNYDSLSYPASLLRRYLIAGTADQEDVVNEIGAFLDSDEGRTFILETKPSK